MEKNWTPRTKGPMKVVTADGEIRYEDTNRADATRIAENSSRRRPRSGWREFRSKFNSTCYVCGEPIDVGTIVLWKPGKARHRDH